MTKKDITAAEYNPYYKTYIDKIANGDLIDLLFESQQTTVTFFKNVPEDKYLFRYDYGKWSVLEVFQHIIDTERIFAYRALRFSRMDATPLSGFDQDLYITASQANNKQMAHLIKEYDVVRQNSIALFQSLSGEQLAFIGTASDSPMSARAAAAIMVGHETHHVSVIQEHYL